VLPATVTTTESGLNRAHDDNFVVTARAIAKIDRFCKTPLEPVHVMSRTWRATIRS
jgi:hypothetical protein